VNAWLALQFHLNNLKRTAKIRGIMCEGLHVHNLTCLHLNVFALSIRVRELGFAVVQEDRNRLGMAVHHRLFFGSVLDTHDTDFIVLEFYCVVAGIGFDWGQLSDLAFVQLP
jgi:hypothetical protein